MRKTVLALVMAFGLLAAGWAQVAAGDAFDFGDMPPLPPPLLDDAPPPPPVSTSPAAPTLPPSLVSPVAPPPGGGDQSLPLLPGTGGGADQIDLLGGVTPAVPPASVTPTSPVPLVPPSTPQASAPLVPEVPRPGKITGGRVNVRAGPNTQYESIAVLTTGTPVTVMAKNSDWFKIMFPEDQLASIHKNAVDADITGEIPEAGLPGVVNTDNADVHAFYWDKSTIVGKLNKGDPVVIKQERGQWYRIAAPESARAYVSAQYVRLDGAGEVAVDSAPPPANPAVDLSVGSQGTAGKLILSENDRRAASIKDAYFRRLREQEANRQEEEEQQVSRLTQALEDFDARVSEIDRELSAALPYSNPAVTEIGSAAWAPPDPLYGGYVGWLENIGRVGNAPASFRLTKGGEIRYFLRSDSINLGEFVGRRVWVNGGVETAPGAPANMLNVAELRVLTESEIADGMRQMGMTYGSTTTTTTYAPVVDPFGTAIVAATPGYPVTTDQLGITYTLPETVVESQTTTPPYGAYGETTTVTTQTYQSQTVGSPVYYSEQTQMMPGQVYQVPSTPGAVEVFQSYDPYSSTPAPAAVPATPGTLPDVVGIGAAPYGSQPPAASAGTLGLTSSYGEVESDYYDQPIVQEIY